VITVSTGETPGWLVKPTTPEQAALLRKRLESLPAGSAARAAADLRASVLRYQWGVTVIGLADASPEQVERMRTELLAVNRRTERLIDGLLVLARGERGLDAREPVRLDEIAEEAAEPLRPAAERGGDDPAGDPAAHGRRRPGPAHPAHRQPAAEGGPPQPPGWRGPRHGDRGRRADRTQHRPGGARKSGFRSCSSRSGGCTPRVPGRWTARGSACRSSRRSRRLTTRP
jgi:signal transduction histidine kinase